MTLPKITEAEAEELLGREPAQKMYATKYKDGGFKAASSKQLMGYDTEIAAIPWANLQAWHTELAQLRQDKAELVAILDQAEKMWAVKAKFGSEHIYEVHNRNEVAKKASRRFALSEVVSVIVIPRDNLEALIDKHRKEA